MNNNSKRILEAVTRSGDFADLKVLRAEQLAERIQAAQKPRPPRDPEAWLIVQLPPRKP